MNRKTRVAPALLVAIAASAAAACHKPAPPPAPVQAVNQDSIDAANRAREDSMRAEQARRDSIARAEADAARMKAEREAAINEMKATLAQPVYFAFDSDALSDSSQATLDKKLAIMNGNPSLRIRVEGNTDARGSDEYNMALGQRRAASAKRYLTQHGIDDSRIDIISYGEERPVASGNDEASYAQNRRDNFVITAGADQLQPVATQ
ncbi:MAG TPA: peptidoglycan-associated lipoprotein Pal [Gemmatimonadaceae bacterium]|nr:peptidoglycan-associated lipoprotein Pal [Gemmatimonadaceae bacterium]